MGWKIPAWKRPWPEPKPWTPEEEARLIDAAGCGLSCDYWKDIFPDRRFGDVADKALNLREAGQLRYPRPI